jgi:hypothetical protein
VERVFSKARERPGNMNWTYGPGEVVTAAAVVAAGLPGGDPALADAALDALLIAAGRDGAWHVGWTDPGLALQARGTASQLASVFYRYQHRHDQPLPLEP